MNDEETSKRHISDEQLAALAAAGADDAQVPAHLSECAECRAALDEVRAGVLAISALPIVAAPDAIWSRIEAELPGRRRPHWLYAAGIAAAVLLAVVLLRRTEPTGWQLTGIDGAVRPVQKGEWIEHRGAPGDLHVQAGSIGSVRIAPDTRVRLVAATAREQRMALAYGRIQVHVTAPPRLFQVETAAGTAVDLGCEYELACDRTGNGFLRVTQGWVAYEWQGRESLVPAGASCRTTAGQQPGIPVFDDAAPVFLESVRAFERSAAPAVDELLDNARPRDTLTLWHLLPRVDDAGVRVRILEKMIALTSPLPAGVTREAVLALDRDALRRWREELAWTW